MTKRSRMPFAMAEALAVMLAGASAGNGERPVQDKLLPPPQSKFCSAPEYRQFDFWLGSWHSYDAKGKLQGQTSIEKIQGGCVLYETWTGSDGSGGNSFSIYDASRKIWNQTWVSNHGTLLPIEGYLQGNTMVLTGFHIGANGRNQLHRTIWRPTPEGAYQLWDYSEDGGKTWTVNYEGFLRKIDKPHGPN